MADAFRGLTIKIGADARPLNSALNSIKSSAGQAQRQMNRLTRALNVDPTNLSVMARRLDLAGDKARMTARSFNLVKAAITQSKDQMLVFSKESGIMGGKLSEVARRSTDIYAQTQRIRAEYNSTNKQLQLMYDSMVRYLNKQKGIVKKDAIKEVDNLRKGLAKGGEAAEQAEAKIRSMLYSMAQTKGTVLPFGGEGFAHNFADANKLIGVFNRLRTAQKTFQGDIENFNKVEGFRAAKTEAAAFEAELRGAVAETVKMKTELYALRGARGFISAINDTKQLDAAIDKAGQAARAADDAYQMMPSSIKLATERAKAFAEEETVLQEKAKALSTAMKALEREGGFDRRSAAVKDAYLNLEQAQKEATKTGVALEKASTKLDGFEDEMRQAKNAAFIGPSRPMENIQADIDKTSAKLKEVEGAAKKADVALDKAAKVAKWRDFDTELKGVKTRVDAIHKASSRLRTVGDLFGSLRTAGYGPYSTITPTIMMAGRYAIQAANDVDAAYRDMRKTVNGTEEEFEHLKQAALDFSTTHVTTADTILEIEAMGGQLGIAAQNLEGFAEVTSNLDIATDMESEDIAKSIGQLSNIMSDINQHKDDPVAYQHAITSFSDSLVRLGNNSAAQESSIMKVMMRIASIGNISGMTTPQLLAISTAVAATGQGCEAAGTAISKTFSNIETAVGKGGDKLAAFAKVSSMSTEEFANAWKNNPVEAFTAFIEGLKRIDTSGGSVDRTLADLGITSVRQKQALMGLTNTLDVLHDSLGMSQDAWDGLSTTMADGKVEEAGDAAREAQRKSEGFSGQLQIMKNNATMLANQLADGVAPYLKIISDLFATLTKRLSESPQGFKTFIVGAAAIAAATGPMLVAVGSIGSAIINITEAFKKLRQLTVFNKAIQQLDMMAVRTDKVGIAAAKMKNAFRSVGSIGIAGWGVAIGAGIFAITELVRMLDEARKHQELLAKGTEASAHMFDGIVQSAPTAQGAIESVNMSLDECKQATEDVANTQIQVADALDKGLFKNAQSGERLDGYVSTIERLGNKSDLTKQQLAELRAAVSKFNELSGTNLQVKDDGSIEESGKKVDNLTKKIERLAQVQKMQWKLDLYEEQWKAQQEGLSKASEEAAKAQEKIKELQKDSELNPTNAQANEVLIDSYQKVIDKYYELEGDSKKLEDNINTLNIAMNGNGKTVEDAILRYSNLDSVLEQGGFTNTQFADALKGLGLGFEELNGLSEETIGSIAAGWNGTLPNLIELLGQNGVKIDETIAQMAQLAETEGLSAEQFSMLYQNAGGDMELLQDKLQAIADLSLMDKQITLDDDGTIEIAQQDLASLNSMQIGKKEFYVTDNGSIFNSEGKLTNLKLFKIGKKIYTVSDNGTVKNERGKVNNLKGIKIGKKTYVVSDDGTIYDQEKKIGEIDGKKAKAYVTADSKNADKAAARVKKEFDSLNKTKANPKVNTNADSEKKKVDNLQTAITNLKGKTVTINVKKNGSTNVDTGGKPKSAKGHVFPNTGIIPRNASGGVTGIVTKATMTNVGLVGEDGAEALLRYGRSSAVIPLSNRRYVRPFARAVAREMGGGTTVNNYYSVGNVSYAEGTSGAQAVEAFVHEVHVASRRG